jgi:hypothetical protein
LPAPALRFLIFSMFHHVPQSSFDDQALPVTFFDTATKSCLACKLETFSHTKAMWTLCKKLLQFHSFPFCWKVALGGALNHFPKKLRAVTRGISMMIASLQAEPSWTPCMRCAF